MDQKKVADLAKSYSLSCKKLVKDTKLMRTLTAPSAVLVSLTVIHLVSIVPLKSPWEFPC
jgi:hypothetical protein